MSLPDSRNTTYAANSQVKSADLNDIQDTLINLWAGCHGDVVEHIHPSSGQTNDFVSYNFTDRYMASTAGAAQVDFPLPVREGDRIKSFTIARYGAGASNLTFRVIKVTAAGVASEVETALSINNPAAAWTDSTFDMDPDVVVGAGECFFLAAEMGASGIRVGSIRMTKDHPP